MKKISLLKIALALNFCFIIKLTIAQQWVPDTGNQFGPGTTTRTTTSTNSETNIPETKTEFKDANGVTRKETINTKDLDGNNVTKEKTYDQSGKLIKESENISDPN